MCTPTETSRTSSPDATLRGMVDDHLAMLLERIEHPQLREASTYAVLGGGKRVRPLIALRCCALVESPIESALPAGCAFELIHAFSLVHDDLPALDDDDPRRGRPTVHKQFDEAIGVLAGDMLQAMAFTAAAASSSSAN